MSDKTFPHLFVYSTMCTFPLLFLITVNCSETFHSTDCLQYLWTRETPATFSEIMVHFNEEEKKAWKKQTVNTFLSRLAQKGFLNIDKSGKRAIYIPSVTSKKFYENYAQEIVKDSYNGAIKDFIAAFTAGNKLSAAEKAELLSYIQTL